MMSGAGSMLGEGAPSAVAPQLPAGSATLAEKLWSAGTPSRALLQQVRRHAHPPSSARHPVQGCLHSPSHPRAVRSRAAAAAAARSDHFTACFDPRQIVAAVLERGASQQGGSGET
jgi:hypothetical protein